MSSKTTGTRENRMTPEEVDAKLADQALCRVATILADGGIYQTPLWFAWDPEERVFWLTFENTKRRHVQNLLGNPQLSIVVDEDPRVTAGLEKGAWAVIGRGKAEVISDWNVIPRVLKRILTGAIGPDGAAEYMKELTHDDRVVVRLAPEKLVSWDYGKATR